MPEVGGCEAAGRSSGPAPSNIRVKGVRSTLSFSCRPLYTLVLTFSRPRFLPRFLLLSISPSLCANDLTADRWFCWLCTSQERAGTRNSCAESPAREAGRRQGSSCCKRGAFRRLPRRICSNTRTQRRQLRTRMCLSPCCSKTNTRTRIASMAGIYDNEAVWPVARFATLRRPGEVSED